jgi:hypothetical protein
MSSCEFEFFLYEGRFLTKGLDTQFQKLLVQPLQSTLSNNSISLLPQVVVIDGLDQCHNQEEQARLVRSLAYFALQTNGSGIPTRVVLTSRPTSSLGRGCSTQ